MKSAASKKLSPLQLYALQYGAAIRQIKGSFAISHRLMSDLFEPNNPLLFTISSRLEYLREIFLLKAKETYDDKKTQYQRKKETSGEV